MVQNSRFFFYEPRMSNYLTSPTDPIGKHLIRKGRLIEAAAKRQVGVRTGALRSSIHMRHVRDPRRQYVKIGSNLPYARMHHEGTRPHLITPNNRKMLKFTTRGQVVFAYAVRHPGTRPNRYLTDNLRRFIG